MNLFDNGAETIIETVVIMGFVLIFRVRERQYHLHF